MRDPNRTSKSRSKDFPTASDRPVKFEALIQKKEENHWGKIFAYAPVGLAIVDLDGVYKEVNPSFLRLTGYSEDEIRELTVITITHPDDVPQNRFLLNRLLQDEIKNYQLEKRIICKDKTSVWVRNTVALTRDYDGNPLSIVTVTEDITEQRMAAQVIRNGEARLRATISYTSVGISLFSMDLHFEEVNPALAKMLGYHQDEMIGLAVSKVTHPDFIESTIKACDDIRLGICAYTRLTKKCQRKDGSLFWAQSTLSLIKDDKGKPLSFVAVTEDTTSRVLAEESLQRSQEKLALAVNVARIGFFNWDIPGDRIEFSRHMSEDFGLSGEPIGLNSLIEIIHPDDRPTLWSMIHEFSSEGGSQPRECRVIRPDGAVVWIDLKGHMSYDKDGHATRFFGTAINITDRKRIEEKLRRGEEKVRVAEERMRLATQAARIGVWDLSPSTQVVTLSERAQEILQNQGDYFVTLAGISKQTHRLDRRRAMKAYLRAIDPRGKGEYSVTCRYLTKDNQLRWLQSVGQTHFEGEGQDRRAVRLLGTLLDVTEQVRLEEDLKAAKTSAEVANATKSAFLANMSHEIRTPLSAILGFSDLLLDKHSSEEERERYLNTIIRNGRTLMHIIDDILDLSKVEAGRLELEKINIPFYKFMEEVTDLFREKARIKDIYMSLEISETVPSVVSSDPTRLRQILINLIGNAVKFTDAGGVTVKVDSSIDPQKQLHLRISVSDTGIGITEDQQKRIFKPFTQADNSTTRRFGGTGLGLYLAKRLALALNGDIELKNCGPGKGCTFELQFTAEMPKSYLAHEVFDQERVRFEDSPLRGLKILVAEDAFDNQLLIETILSGCGAKVVLANNGLDAVYKASHDNFDIVLMDLQMPKMDGYEATETLRRQGYAKPILALTAHAMVEERQRTRRAGCDAHLTKPLDPKDLVDKIVTFVRKPYPYFSNETPSHF
jgi:PAS domain S-box-containing protein